MLAVNSSIPLSLAQAPELALALSIKFLDICRSSRNGEAGEIASQSQCPVRTCHAFGVYARGSDRRSGGAGVPQSAAQYRRAVHRGWTERCGGQTLCGGFAQA